MVAEKMLELATTKRATWIVFAHKKCGPPRFYGNYWNVNDVIIRDSYLLPHKDEHISTLSEGTMFPTLNAS